MIQLHDLTFEPFISEERIKTAISEIIERINNDYQGKKPVFLGVLNGAFRVASEIISGFNGDCEVMFVKLKSYAKTESTGNVETFIGLDMNLEGREIVVLEDIVDTGNTLDSLDALLKKEKVKDYKIATLFFKPEAYTQNHKIDYIGMEIPTDFIVGYGLDYDGLGRNLSQIYKLKK